MVDKKVDLRLVFLFLNFESEISTDEIKIARRHLKNEKPSGEDNITIELFKAGGPP